MNQDQAKEVRNKLGQALLLIKEAVDLSVFLVKKEGKEQIKVLWEDFIRDFVSYTKKKSQETGVDLTSLVSLRRIIK